MSNTVISLKKSNTTSAVPSSLEFGELAINYADGALFYKHSNNSIAVFSSGGAGGDSFGTVNAAGTLIVADTPGDILTLEAGTGISITGDAINDKITIEATGGTSEDVFARQTANAAFDKANTSPSTFTTNVGDNSNNTFDITHDLNKDFVIPAVRENATGYYVYPDIKQTTSNNIVLEFSNVPTANQYVLIVIG
jgi:hypothetical protein